MTIRLHSTDAAVLNLTLDALKTVKVKDAFLSIRCSECHKKLAVADESSHGPLFCSMWDVEVPLDWVHTVDGRVLPRRQARRLQDELTPVDSSYGRPIDNLERLGSLVLLALPPGFPDDYPELMVRCPQHGDAVLERSDIATALRRHKKRNFFAHVTFPRLEYVRPTYNSTGRAEPARQWERRRAHPSSPISFEEIDRRLGWS